MEIRESRGISQYKVAEVAGISQSYYAEIETGNRGHKLPVPTAMKIADVLGFDWKRFYTDQTA